MNEFTASNGVTVKPRETGAEVVVTGDMRALHISAEKKSALREFFRAEEDERLGRWRWPENPDYVVYPPDPEDHDEDPSIRILFEPGGGSSNHYTRKWLAAVTDPDRWAVSKCARAYFDSHPGPQPWHDAKPGEVWVVTHGGMTEPLLVADFAAEGRSFADAEERTMIPTADPEKVITDAHRIYPEGES